jgi:quinoprotein dehydrogenase-associated probable ABC transporter substrate-binding protein
MARAMRAPIAAAALASLMFGAVGASAQTTELNDRSALRVCADPNHLPYSNEAKQGFENKIVELLGAEFNLPVTYVWFPQGPGFVKNTLGLRRCDLIPGIVGGDDTVTTTTPYYYTTSVMLVPQKGPKISGLDDPQLKGKKIGVVANTPPVNFMLKYGLMADMHSYAQNFDSRNEDPTHQLVQDLTSGVTDVALVWGPIGGYWVKKDNLPIDVIPLKGEAANTRLDYHIAMGVRGTEPEWRRKVGAALTKHKAEIDKILLDYGVPLLNEQGEPIQASGSGSK